MGYFQAKKTKDDQPVTFSDGLITDTPSDTTPSIEAYYGAILNAVNLGFITKTPSNTAVDTIFGDNAKNLWGIGHNESLPSPFGYFTNEGNRDVIMDRIAEEENKYYWQWMDDNKEVKDGDDVILNLFRIVNTRLIDRMFIYSDKADSNFKTWKKEKGYEKSTEKKSPKKYVKLQDDIVPSILISPSGFVYLKREADAHANPKPKLLFLDKDEKTQQFYYKKEGKDHYEPQRTWNYNHQSFALYNSPSYKEYKIVELASPNYSQDDQLDQLRYYEAYVAAYNKYIKSDDYTTKYNALEDKNKGKKATLLVAGGGTTRIPNLLNYNIGDKNNSEIKKQLGNTIYEQKKDEFKEIAENAAQQLPSKTHCFYYDDNNELKGFISMVSIREGGKGGGSGYEMRADKVDEVHYQFIQQDTTDGDYLDGLVRTRIFGLDNKHVKTETPTIKNIPGYSNDNDHSFYPTNWPYDKDFIESKIGLTIGENGDVEDDPMTGQSAEGLTMNSRFWYYKNFKNGAARRNKPKEPPKLPPFPPRLTNNQFEGYPYLYKLKAVTENTNNSEKYVKLNKISYRKWKKGNGDEKGVPLGRNDKPRIDAGTAMAEALRGFQIYEGMKTATEGDSPSITPKVSNSKLPATAFVKYVLGHDKKAKAQWKTDNEIAEANAQSLKTDQEWCHLYGHGDGGSEDLSNFVAGSKHCNTEQLAIEVGQRRVTQADFFKEEAKNITAKITAYLLPNQGTWLTGGTYTQDELIEKLGGSPDKKKPDSYTNWLKDFFPLPPNNGEATKDDSEGDVIMVYDHSTNWPNKFFEQTDNKGHTESNNGDKDMKEENGDTDKEKENEGDGQKITYKLISEKKTNPEEDSKLEKAFDDLSAAIRTANEENEENEENEKNKKAHLLKFKHSIETHFFMYLPIARWMRYKIYYKHKKVFDHIYDAQSESTNVHECQILDDTVERVLYKAIAADYKKSEENPDEPSKKKRRLDK